VEKIALKSLEVILKSKKGFYNIQERCVPTIVRGREVEPKNSPGGAEIKRPRFWRSLTIIMFPKATLGTEEYYTASDKDENVKSLIRIGGISMLLLLSVLTVRSGLPNASRLLSIIIGLSLNLKFFIGNFTWPFSI